MHVFAMLMAQFVCVKHYVPDLELRGFARGHAKGQVSGCLVLKPC